MNLLMLTKLYPFGTGEAFIENEINVIAEYYEKIVIVACEVPEEEKKQRELPRNVIAYKVSAKSKKMDLVRGCMHATQRDYNFNDEKKECKNNVQKLFLNYFEEKSKRIYYEILKKNYLKKIKDAPFVLYSYWLFTTARVGTLLAENENISYMYTRAHRYDLYDNYNKIGYLPYRKLFLNKYNMVLPCSDNGTEYLKKTYPDLAKHIQTSLLGTLDHGIGQKSSDGVFRIVSCSRLEPVKRVEKIAEALSLITDDTVQIEWTHIGDGSEFYKLKQYVSKKIKNVKVKMLGSMKNSDIMKLYGSYPFDLFINVSSSEGLPVSIMEALSFGIPCVATNVGGTSEIVIDDVTGKLIHSDFTVQELANIIENFASGNMKNISRRSCRNYWEKHFQAIDNYTKLYEMLKQNI